MTNDITPEAEAIAHEVCIEYGDSPDKELHVLIAQALVDFKAEQLSVTITAGKLTGESIARIDAFVESQRAGTDYGKVLIVEEQNPKTIYVLMADLDGSMRSSADCAVGWTPSKARALEHLNGAAGWSGRAVIICDDGEHGRNDFQDTRATRFARREDLA